MITLKNLNQATAQEVFDQVAEHMLTQMEKSSDAEGACFYRHLDGVLKCAAGCLIADDEYKPEWDVDGGTCWGGLVANKEVTMEHEDLIATLQNIHDNYSVSKWKFKLADIAADYDLEFKFY